VYRIANLLKLLLLTLFILPASAVKNANGSTDDANSISLFESIGFDDTMTNAYSQSEISNSTNSNTTQTVNIKDIQLKKVHVGDIEIAYKTFGNGDPLLLISGSGNVMDFWPTSFIHELSKDHKVIIFDNRGVGNTTSGTRPFTIMQFANDTAEFLRTLKLQQTDVLGFSMGSFVAQHLALTYPEKVNRLILYGAACGGQEGYPQSSQVVKVLSDFVNNQSRDDTAFLEVTFPHKWITENPNFLETLPKSSEIILSTTIKKQFELNEKWLSKNWTGVCNQLQKVNIPTLIMTGTEDQAVPTANSLVLADKIPGAWLVQIKNAGHGLMYQYPGIFTQIVKIFLETTDNVVS
jgi:pimeloyl-ACP methyl ester carboxylesterase